MPQRPILVTVFAFTLFAVGSPHLNAEESANIDERFRKLIPAATAIDRREYEAMGRSGKSPTAETFQEHTLSAALILHKIIPVPAGVKPQFRLIWNIPRPTDMMKEMYRPVGTSNAQLLNSPVTMIHSERITRCEAKIEGNMARGSFDFRVPDLYEGSADFVAKKKGEGDWQMVEFQMKTIGVHVVRDAEGKWQRVESKENSKAKGN